MPASLRSRVGISLGFGLGCIALVICAAPWVSVARRALGITGIWVGPSAYYAGSLITAAAGIVAAAVLVQRELKGLKIVVVVLCVLVLLSAIASLALSALISIGMSS